MKKTHRNALLAFPILILVGFLVAIFDRIQIF